MIEEKIMALSWKQPYGSAILIGKQETRTWPTKYRGLVLICTSKQAYPMEALTKISDQLGFSMLIHLSKANIDVMKSVDLNGYAIGIGELYDCKPMELKDEEITFVRFRKDLFVHFYKNVMPITPFEWKGSLGFKTLTQEQKEKIKVITLIQQVANNGK